MVEGNISDCRLQTFGTAKDVQFADGQRILSECLFQDADTAQLEHVFVVLLECFGEIATEERQHKST
jgi:hypothetical protein